MVMLDSLPFDGREVDTWHDVQQADGAGWLSITRGARPQVHFCVSLPFVAGSHSSVGLLLEDQIRLTLCNMVPCFLVMFHSLGETTGVCFLRKSNAALPDFFLPSSSSISFLSIHLLSRDAPATWLQCSRYTAISLAGESRHQ
jgi:hypothetical protein